MSTLVVDHAKSRLSSSIGTFTDGTISVDDGSSFPDPGATANPGTYWVGVWDDVLFPDPADDPNWEEMLVTAKSVNDLTVWRPNPVSHVDTSRVRIMASVANIKGRRRKNVRDYGATGDGTTDDTSAIQKAFEFATDGDEIYFPVGSYKITARVNVTAGVRVFGDRLASTILNHTGASEARMFSVTAANVLFENLEFSSAGDSTAPTVRKACIHFVGPIGQCYVRDCNFADLKRFGTLNQGTASTFSEYPVIFSDVTIGEIRGCVTSDVSGGCCFIERSTELYIERNKFELAAPATVGVLHHIRVHEDSQNIWIRHNFFGQGFREEGAAVELASLVDSPNPPINERIYVEDNVFDGCEGASEFLPVIACLSCNDVFIRRNTIVNCDESGNVMIWVAANQSAAGWRAASERVTVEDNHIVAGATLQMAINVENIDPSAAGGKFVDVTNNRIVSDGTNFFASGIRFSTIQTGRISGNEIEWKWDSGQSKSPYGIHVTEVTAGTCQNVKVTENTIDAGASTGAAGQVRLLTIDAADTGEPNQVIIDGNTFRGTGDNQEGVRLAADLGRLRFGPNNTFELTGTGAADLSVAPGITFEDRLMFLGNYYIHVDDSGRLRIGSTKPALESDNTIVGTQT